LKLDLILLEWHIYPNGLNYSQREEYDYHKWLLLHGLVKFQGAPSLTCF